MEFTQAIADTICERIADGKSLRSILKSDGMPASSSVFKWLSQDTAFAEQYARAREAQADVLFDEIQDIADYGKNDTYIGKNGEEVNQDVVARSKLRMEARRWMAGKLKPKVYGDKLDLTHGGSMRLISASEATDDVLAHIATAGSP